MIHLNEIACVILLFHNLVQQKVTQFLPTHVCICDLIYEILPYNAKIEF